MPLAIYRDAARPFQCAVRFSEANKNCSLRFPTDVYVALIGDVIVCAKSVGEHLKSLSYFFERLLATGLKLRPLKWPLFSFDACDILSPIKKVASDPDK